MVKKFLFLTLLAMATGCLENYETDHRTIPVETPPDEVILARFDTNGERIYHTGFNDKGERIPFDGGPDWISPQEGACVDCHGNWGGGGVVPHKCTKVAPPIKFDHLSLEDPEEHEVPEEPYTEDLIKRAINEGLDSTGAELDPCMVRWGMSDEDLDDLIEYLKTL